MLRRAVLGRRRAVGRAYPFPYQTLSGVFATNSGIAPHAALPHPYRDNGSRLTMVSVLKALMILKCKLYAEAELHRSTPQSLSGYLPIPLIACTSLSALRGYLARREATSEARTMMLTESGSLLTASRCTGRFESPPIHRRSGTRAHGVGVGI